MHPAKMFASLASLAMGIAGAPTAPAQAQSTVTSVHVATIGGHAARAVTLRRLLREHIDDEPALVETDRRHASLVVRGTVECDRRRTGRRDHEVRCEVSWVVTTAAREEMRIVLRSAGTARGPSLHRLEEAALAATARGLVTPLCDSRTQAR